MTLNCAESIVSRVILYTFWKYVVFTTSFKNQSTTSLKHWSHFLNYPRNNNLQLSLSFFDYTSFDDHTKCKNVTNNKKIKNVMKEKPVFIITYNTNHYRWNRVAFLSLHILIYQRLHHSEATAVYCKKGLMQLHVQYRQRVVTFQNICKNYYFYHRTTISLNTTVSYQILYSKPSMNRMFLSILSPLNSL